MSERQRDAVVSDVHEGGSCMGYCSKGDLAPGVADVIAQAEGIAS